MKSDTVTATAQSLITRAARLCPVKHGFCSSIAAIVVAGLETAAPAGQLARDTWADVAMDVLLTRQEPTRPRSAEYAAQNSHVCPDSG
jgi:hypothetical protein